MKHGQYLTALVALHEAIRTLGDGGDENLKAELEKLGLQTISV